MRTTLLMMLAGFFGMCGSLADQKTVDPSLRLSCNALSLSQDGRQQLLPVLSWGMSLGLKIEKPVGWKLVWFEKDKVRVTVEDSLGNKTTDVSCHYSNMDENDAGSLRLFPQCWKPAVGSQWVKVKGSVTFVVSHQHAVSEPVTVKLVKDVSVPVLLKGAGLAGEDGKPVDVKATLKVKDYVDVGKKGKKGVEFQLVSDRRLGFRAFELQTTKGQPVIAECIGGGTSVNVGACDWIRILQMDDVPEGEVRVMVRYATELQRTMAMVDSRAALSGFGGGEVGEHDGKATPGVNGKAEVDNTGTTPVVVVPQPEPDQASSVKANLEGFDIRRDGRWIDNVLQESPLKLVFTVRLEAKGSVGFGGRTSLGEQSLEVTDSTGRMLSPAVFNLEWLYQQKENGVYWTFIEGKGPELASPGAEWVRVKGTLRVPVAGMKESPVYELPLVKGAEQHVPVPGLEETGGDTGDVARAGDAPTCRLWLEEVGRKENGDVQVKVFLQVDGVPFEFDGFELVDDKGKSLDVDAGYSVGGISSNDKWGSGCTIKNAAGMKNLRVKVKYKADADAVSVPVDMKVGLGGIIPRKVADKKK